MYGMYVKEWMMIRIIVNGVDTKFLLEVFHIVQNSAHAVPILRDSMAFVNWAIVSDIVFMLFWRARTV